MERTIVLDGFLIIIRITVDTSVTAGVVGSDVAVQQTGAGTSCGCAAGIVTKFLTDGTLQDFAGKTSGTIDAEGCEFNAFCAGFYRYSILAADFTEGFSKSEAVRLFHVFAGREVPSGFFIEVEKADDADVGVSGKFCGHFFKRSDMMLERICFCQKNRVIPPADPAESDMV